MSDTSKPLHDFLADITANVREVATFLSDPDHWQKVDGVNALQFDFGESAPQLKTLKSRIDDMESRLVDLGLRIENVIQTGPESIRDLMREGMEGVQNAQKEVGSVRARWRESDPKDHVIRVRELFDQLGIDARPETPVKDVELELVAAYAATYGAERLPVHGERLSEWISQMDRAVESTSLDGFINPDDAAAMSPESAGTYLYELRGKTVSVDTCIKNASTILKAPKYRTPDGKKIYKWAVKEIAADLEKKAADRADKRLKKKRGNLAKNSNPNNRF